MLKLVEGNLLEADVDALVNTVNTVGVMGKGIALQFKKAFPEMFKDYKAACKSGNVEIGKMHIHDRGAKENPRYIVNFPTKKHWQNKSKLSDIDSGLAALVKDIERTKIKSIAVPPLGCGLGGLRWDDVYPLIRQYLGPIAEIDVLVFAPTGAPASADMVNRTTRPEMTPNRAAVLCVLDRYCAIGYELTVLEIQKLLYLLQIVGEPLKLRFTKGFYGPYADNLRHVLHRFENHFTEGFGDGRNEPRTPIRLLNSARDEAAAVWHSNAGEVHKRRVERVFQLIEGFETPYGMELLSSVHWVAVNDRITDLHAVVSAVYEWNDRKRRVMKVEHIEIAWERLKTNGWLDDRIRDSLANGHEASR